MSDRYSAHGGTEIVELRATLTRAEVLRTCAVSERELEAMIADAVVRPVDRNADEFTFAATSIARIKRLAALQRELDIDSHAAAIVLDLIEQLQAARRGGV